MRFLEWNRAHANGVKGFSAFRRTRRISGQKMTKEYQRLKQMVPSIAAHTRVSKVKFSPHKKKEVI